MKGLRNSWLLNAKQNKTEQKATPHIYFFRNKILVNTFDLWCSINLSSSSFISKMKCVGLLKGKVTLASREFFHSLKAYCCYMYCLSYGTIIAFGNAKFHWILGPSRGPSKVMMEVVFSRAIRHLHCVFSFLSIICLITYFWSLHLH